MLIRVSEIPEEGLSVEGVGGFSHLFTAPGWALEALSLRVERDGDEVRVSGRLAARALLACSRCLEAVQVEPRPRVEVCYRSRPSGPRPSGYQEEVELSADDLDLDFFTDDLLDLDRLVQTETELALPMKALCRPDCRGLCLVCGGNRNVTPCACEVPPPDARLAALKDLQARLSSR